MGVSICGIFEQRLEMLQSVNKEISSVTLDSINSVWKMNLQTPNACWLIFKVEGCETYLSKTLQVLS